MSLLTVLLVLCLATLVLGGLGYPRYGYTGFSPLGAIVVLLIVLWALGYLH